jgi:site-specific DNA-cytosine methylase
MKGTKNKILIACEESGRARDAFRKRGFDAMSCDILPTRTKPEFHIQGDVLPLLRLPWLAVIAFPPCTDLSSSGARWFKEKQKDGRQKAAIDFFMACVNANSEHVAIENPVGIMSSVYCKPAQIIQPWQFGHGETKATCLWLKGLPPLKPSKIVDGREPRIWKMPPGPDRARLRSETYAGIANAMAAQWGAFLKGK